MQATIKTISHAMGISVSTVSKALNGYSDISEETRNRVVAVASEMGYIPNMMARNLVKQVSNVVGVIIPDIETSIYGEIFKSIQVASRANDINLFLCDCNRDLALEREYVRSILESQAKGLIIAPCTSKIGHIKDMVADRLPVVYVGGKVEDEQETFVSSDNASGARFAVEYLVDLGHTNIMMLNDTQTSVSCSKRVSGYEQTMREHGLQPHVLLSRNENLSAMECGYQLTKKILQDPHRPTALFAVKDTVAIGALQALNEAGVRVPQDMSVVGYDDIAMSSLPMINLTTIAQPKKEMGERSMQLLLNCVESGRPDIPEHFYAHPSLVVRASCGPVPKLW